jgi:transglutaminase/protease-like cytokinesis protein 3
MWVCANITNNYNLYTKNSRKRKRYLNNAVLLDNWNTEFKREIFKKLIEDKSTICTGYAYLMKEMANIANIDCEIIHGYGKTSTMNIETITMPNHSWNAVKLNNKWYLCDPTWASGLIDPETFQFKFEFKEGLFLPSPDLFVMNHYPIDEKWMLLQDNAPTFEMFLESPLIYNKAYAQLVGHISPLKMHETVAKHESISFKYQLANPESDNEASLLIDDGRKTSTTKPINTKIVDDILSFEYQFDKNGFYDVHFLINDHLISTYTFRVKG